MRSAACFLLVAAALLVPSCVAPEKTEVVDPGGVKETSPVLENARDHVLKRRVAIARFSNETLYGKSVLLLREADFVAGQASNTLAGKLAETNKFVLVEYTDTERLLEALDYKEVGDLGIAADYVILGAVVEFGRETEGKTGFLTRTKVQKAHARVTVRLVDVRTSRIIFATEGAGAAESEVGDVFGFGTKEDYDSTLNDKAISAAIAQVVGNLSEKLLEQPWRSTLLRIDGDSVIISGGKSQGIRVGDEFSVMLRGEVVENPRTGIPVELPGEKVAVIRVADTFGSNVDDEGSRCTVVSGSFPSEELDVYVVQEVAQ